METITVKIMGPAFCSCCTPTNGRGPANDSWRGFHRSSLSPAASCHKGGPISGRKQTRSTAKDDKMWLRRDYYSHVPGRIRSSACAASRRRLQAQVQLRRTRGVRWDQVLNQVRYEHRRVLQRFGYAHRTSIKRLVTLSWRAPIHCALWISRQVDHCRESIRPLAQDRLSS